MKVKKRIGSDLIICLLFCFVVSYLFTYIYQDNIAHYFDAVYEDERNLVYQIAEGDVNINEFPGASINRDENLGVIQVYYTHDEKGDFFFSFPIIIQMHEQEIEIPKYFITREAFIIDRTSRKRLLLTFHMTFGLMAVYVAMRMVIRRIIQLNSKELS